MRYQHGLLLLALFGAGLAACRKDKEEAPPSISILSPGDASTLSIPDTLAVTVETSDDDHVEQVSVALLNTNYVPVTASVVATPAGNPATLTLYLPVTSEQIASGTYKLIATATDGESTAKDFREIQVNAAPLRLRAVYAVATPADGTLSVYRIDSLGQSALAGTFNTDFGGAAISSAAQRLFIAGSATGPLLALSPDDLSTAWQQPNQSPVGAPWFTSADISADGRLYVGTADGQVHGYLAGIGTGEMVAQLPEGYGAEQALTVGDLLVCTAKHSVTQAQTIAFFQRSSGAQQGSQYLGMVPVRMFGRDADHVLIFGNQGGQGSVDDLNISGGGSWEAYTWPSAITAAEQVAPGVFAVALANGDLQRFTYENDGALSIGNTAVLNDLAFDGANAMLYGATDNGVVAIDPATGNVLASYPMAGPVRKVLPLLNR